MNQKTTKLLKKLAAYTNKNHDDLKKNWLQLTSKERCTERKKIKTLFRGITRKQRKIESKQYIPTERLTEAEEELAIGAIPLQLDPEGPQKTANDKIKKT